MWKSFLVYRFIVNVLLTHVVLVVQEVQLWDQREGAQVALPKGGALPPAGQRWHHRAALPGHPQHQLPE